MLFMSRPKLPGSLPSAFLTRSAWMLPSTGGLSMFMNKNIQLVSILYEFTLAFCKRYVVSPTQVRLILNSATGAKKELKTSYLADLQDKYQDFLDKNDLEAWPENSCGLRGS